MKNKESAKNKKQSVTLKDLKTRKNPKGGTNNSASMTGGNASLNVSSSGGASRR